MFGSSFIPICFVGTSWLTYTLFVFINVYCPTRFPYHLIFLSFSNDTMGITSGAETARLYRAPVLSPGLCDLCFTICSLLCSVLNIIAFPISPFSFFNCVVCLSSIYDFWLSLWYLQTYLKNLKRTRRQGFIA